MARQYSERNEDVKALFEKVPYLNSSLFEPTDIEHATLFISNLRDDKTLPIYSATVLKDKKGKKRSGELNALEYLFEFLNAYDFSSEGGETIQEDNKTLINASVLGLIFEKINGYKDGSFFTPGFITMYMCRETIRKAVVQKFNETSPSDSPSPSDSGISPEGGEKPRFKTLDDVYDQIDDNRMFTRQQANELINSLKICDPAVGSGHFLVSALNEMIAIKNDLNILQDRQGRRLKEYQVEVVNDELIVTDEDGELFEYNPTAKESQRVQEALFHEKQQIIENCLFGVDINPNSVKICRLRLWIELLKNAYYKIPLPTSPKGGGDTIPALETLPNIDINIKCGNSLISRFDLDADLSKALKDSKWNIDSYRMAVDTYRNAQNKEQKREMEKIIHDIKSDFRSEISANDPKVKRLQKVKGEIFMMSNQTQMFEMSKREKATWNKKLKKFTTEAGKLETQIQEIKDNKIYDNAFEWRFEFPEVLNDDGDYIGFDVVIGNPPYVNFRDIKQQDEKKYHLKKYSTSEYQSDLFILFIDLGLQLLIGKGEFCFIVPNSLTNNLNNSKIREFIIKSSKINFIIDTPIGVFPDATVDTIVISTSLPKINVNEVRCLVSKNEQIYLHGSSLQADFEQNDNYYFDFLTSSESRKIIKRMEEDSVLLDEICESSSGIKEYETGKGKPPQSQEDRLQKVFNSSEQIDKKYRRHISGSEVEKYAINWKGDYILYGKNLAAPRDSKFFEGDRIIIREIPGKTSLIASFTDEDYTVKNTAHVFLVKKFFEAKYVLALLNSILLGFYFKNKFSERDDVFPKAKIGQCRALPIKKATLAQQEIFVTKIDKILNLKEQNLAADTTSLEAEIDRLVYELYGLTEEEIGIIENL